MKNVFVQHVAQIWDGCDDYHWEITAGEDFLHIQYKEDGRTPQPSDHIEIPVELAETFAKTILKLVEKKEG